MFTGCKSQSNEEVYVSDSYNIHEEYKDAWGNVGKYDISLPYIHCDSKSAKKLNKTIKNEYKDLVLITKLIANTVFKLNCTHN